MNQSLIIQHVSWGVQTYPRFVMEHCLNYLWVDGGLRLFDDNVEEAFPHFWLAAVEFGAEILVPF